MTARIELVEDLVAEAALRDQAPSSASSPRPRCARPTRRGGGATRGSRTASCKASSQNEVMIDTAGAAIGQINALTVHDMGDRRFGTPVRVTRARLGRPRRHRQYRARRRAWAARSSRRARWCCKASSPAASRRCGRCPSPAPSPSSRAMAGSRATAPRWPSSSPCCPISRSCRCARTSPSPARSTRPAWRRRSAARYSKIEGFFRVCAGKPGGLTGTQGVIVPEANRVNLMLRDDIAEAVARRAVPSLAGRHRRGGRRADAGRARRRRRTPPATIRPTRSSAAPPPGSPPSTASSPSAASGRNNSPGQTRGTVFCAISIHRWMKTTLS